MLSNMAADDLATQGVRASAVVVLTKCSRIIPTSRQAVLIKLINRINHLPSYADLTVVDGVLLS